MSDKETTLTIEGPGGPVTGTIEQMREAFRRLDEARGPAFFQTPNVPFFLKGLKLWVAEDENGDSIRMADCTFQVAPLTWDFAYDISRKLTTHIFDAIAEKFEPKEELADFTFDLRVEPQGMTYRRDPEYDNSGGFIQDVRIQKLRVNKDPKLGVLFLTFVASFPIVSKDVTSRLVIDLLKEKVYLTFRAMEERLF